ncbi:hypothetical protein GWI33_011229, partial [Rhynchophorus ferrugineus]
MMIVTSSDTKNRRQSDENSFTKYEPLKDTDHPLEVLQRWGSGRLLLRYTTLSAN